MKKLILVLFGLLLAVVVSAQGTRVYNQNIRIDKTTPVLDLQGLGAKIYMDGGTSGTITLQTYAAAGGTLVLPTSLSTDTLATRAYVRAYGGGGGADVMIYPEAGIALSTGAAWSSSITNNSNNWNTAYIDRLKWDGGSTGLVAATGRTSLGGTTVGQSFFTLINPTAIRFPRIKADNSVEALSAADYKTALSLTSTDVGLGNVTNESKATMFTSPTFTGTIPKYGSPVTDTLSTRAYARSAGAAWNGSSAGLVAATGRTSLGGTTVGQAFFTLVNPGAITFPRMNVDNSVSALSASAFTTAIGAGHVSSITATLTAGVLTDVTLTGVTTKPYNIMIQTTGGRDITSAVSDSLAFTGGVYHLHVYTVDLITNAEIKVIH